MNKNVELYRIGKIKHRDTKTQGQTCKSVKTLCLCVSVFRLFYILILFLFFQRHSQLQSVIFVQ